MTLHEDGVLRAEPTVVQKSPCRQGLKVAGLSLRRDAGNSDAARE